MKANGACVDLANHIKSKLPPSSDLISVIQPSGQQVRTQQVEYGK
jgi:hypothetical protein